MNNLFNKTKEVTIEEFTAMWNKGGSVSFAQTSNGDKRDYLYVSKTTDDENHYYTTGMKNVVVYEDAGWVTAGLKVTGFSKEILEVPSLPDDWEEISVVYENYPTFINKVVARNNHDGTVQLFRA